MSLQRSSLRRFATVGGNLLVAVLVLFSVAPSYATELLNRLVRTVLEVPPSLRTTPFDADRMLMVPPASKISGLARIIAARLIMPLSTGEILVAHPGLASILRVPPPATATGDPSAVISHL